MPGPSERKNVTIAAATTNENVLANSFLRQIGGRGAHVLLYATTSVLNDLSCSMLIGAEAALQSGVPGLEVAAGRGPVIPDNLMVDAFGAPGDQLTLSVSAILGADFTYQLVVEPL